MVVCSVLLVVFRSIKQLLDQNWAPDMSRWRWYRPEKGKTSGISSCWLETCDETEALSVMKKTMSHIEGSLAANPKSWLDKKGEPPSRSHFFDGKPGSSS